MPFLIRRRSDGLYFRNALQPSWLNRSRFAADPRDCRPFFTEVGARRSGVPVTAPVDWPPHKLAVMATGRHAGHPALARRFWEEAFDAAYELVEVSV
jgi:hypothetical protein